MTFEAPQIIYLCLTMIGLGVLAAKHGEPKTGHIDFWSSFFATAIIYGLLYWGGFFG